MSLPVTGEAGMSSALGIRSPSYCSGQCYPWLSALCPGMLLNKKCCVQTQPTQLIVKGTDAMSLPCGAAVPVLLPHVCTQDTAWPTTEEVGRNSYLGFRAVSAGDGFLWPFPFFPCLFFSYNFPCKQLPWPFS